MKQLVGKNVLYARINVLRLLVLLRTFVASPFVRGRRSMSSCFIVLKDCTFRSDCASQSAEEKNKCKLLY